MILEQNFKDEANNKQLDTEDIQRNNLNCNYSDVKYPHSFINCYCVQYALGKVQCDIAHIITTIIVRNVALSEQIRTNQTNQTNRKSLPINLITKEPNPMLSVMKYGVSILEWKGSYIILLFFKESFLCHFN